MHDEVIAIEAGDAGMRLEAGMGLRAGPVGPLDQQRISRIARGSDPAAHFLRPVREGRGRPADVLLPGRRRRSAFRDVGGFLAVRFFEYDRRIALARGVQSDHRRQAFARNPDGGDGLDRGLPIPGGNRCDWLADIANHAVVAEQGDRRGHARDRQRRRKIQPGNMCVRHMRAQDDAFELPVVTDIDGVFRQPGHFLPRFDAWRDDIVAVEAAGAGLGHGAEDAVIGAAAAQMT
jgi:hypothetical protein